MEDYEENFDDNNDNKKINDQKDKKKSNKIGINNIDNIENQLKIEYQKEDFKKEQAYKELMELKKEENLINVNIKYFENLLMQLKSNNNIQIQNDSNIELYENFK